MRLSDVPDMNLKILSDTSKGKAIRLSDIPDLPMPKANSPKASLYSEVVSPIIAGGSTFGMGIPRLVAKKQGPGMEQAVFPEQQTVPGKILRGVSETVGFTAGIPGQAGKLAIRGVGTLASKIPQFMGKKLVTKMAQGATAGAVSGALAGDTLQDRSGKAKIGAAIGGVVPAIAPVAKKGFDWIGRLGGTIAGVEKEVFDEASKRGFRNVLQTKFYNKKLPSQIQNRIEQNLGQMEIAAGQEYDSLTAPLRQAPFDMAKLRGDVIKIANRVKKNPFDTESSKLDKQIMDGIINKAQANNLGDALDLRRNLDDSIYSKMGEVKSSFGKEVRDLLNAELHKNKDLSKVDQEWTNLMNLLKSSKKVVGETGEKMLNRFTQLTEKQKQMLVNLEQKVGGLPFVSDLTNYGLAKEFTTGKIAPTFTGISRAIAKPALRSFLRQGEGIGNIEQKAIQGGGKLLKSIQRIK